MRPALINSRRLAPLAFAFAILAACGKQDGEPTRIAVIGATPALVDAVNRPLTSGEAVVRASMAQGLVRFDARGQIVPGLAERWNVSDDGLSYIFRLSASEWPDGRKIKAADVAKVLSRQLRGANGNPLGDTLGGVSEIVPMTDRVIEIRLISPRPNLLQLLAQPEMGVVRAGEGSGPYRPWKSGPALPGTMALEHRIRIVDARDIREHVLVSGGATRALISAFVDGKLDVVLGGRFTDLPFAQAANLPRNSLRFDPAIGLFGLVPTRKDGMAGDREVRRLLSQAIDRTALIADLKVANLVPRATILQPGLDGITANDQPDWLAIKVDDRRQQLSAEANRLFGKLDRTDVRVFLPDGRGSDILLGRLGADWAPLGIKVARAKTRAEADFMLIDEIAPSTSPAWFLRRFRCQSTPVCLPETEEILSTARSTGDARERAALFSAIATKMDEAQLFIPLTAPIRWSLVARGIDGFVENQFARHTLVGINDARAREDAQ